MKGVKTVMYFILFFILFSAAAITHGEKVLSSKIDEVGNVISSNQESIIQLTHKIDSLGTIIDSLNATVNTALTRNTNILYKVDKNNTDILYLANKIDKDLDAFD